MDLDSVHSINLYFSVFMGLLGLIDIISYHRKAHKDFKSVIMSVGILGTFFGIFWGLQDFDTQNIQASVPHLLDGLKIAFFTSIVGMALAILLTIYQRLRPIKSQEQEEIDYFLMQAEKLDEMQYLHNLESLEKLDMLKHLVLIEKHNKSMLNRFNDFFDAYTDSGRGLQEMIRNQFEMTNTSLNATIEQLARGASSEIIKALENVIRDFNTNLTEQFGENFKKLNTSVDALIEWQDNYRSNIREMEDNLRAATVAIDQSRHLLAEISGRNAEVMEVYGALHTHIGQASDQTGQLNAHLETFARLSERADGMFGTLQDGFDAAGRDFSQVVEAFDRSSRDIQESILKQSREYTEKMATMGTEMTDQMRVQGERLLEEQKNLATGLVEETKQSTTAYGEQISELSTRLTREQVEFSTKILEETNHKSLEMQTSMRDSIQATQVEFSDMIRNVEEHYREHVAQVSRDLSEKTGRLKEEMVVFVQERTQEVASGVSEMVSQIREQGNALLGSLTQSSDTFRSHLEQDGDAMKNALVEKVTYVMQKTDEAQIRFSRSLQKTESALQSRIENYYSGYMQQTDDLNTHLTDSFTQMRETLEAQAGQSSEAIKAQFEGAATSATDAAKSMQKAFDSTRNTLVQGHKELDKTLSDLFGNMIKEADQGLGGLHARMGETLKILESGSHEVLSGLNDEMKEEFTHMTRDLREKLLETQNLVKNNTQILAKNYVKFLQESVKQTTEAPKNLTRDMESTFNKLQKELRAYALNTHTSLRDSRADMDKMLHDVQASFHQQLHENKELSEELHKSMRSLDNSLGGLTEQFKNDYDWFLRRVRELIGSKMF